MFDTGFGRSANPKVRTLRSGPEETLTFSPEASVAASTQGGLSVWSAALAAGGVDCVVLLVGEKRGNFAIARRRRTVKGHNEKAKPLKTEREGIAEF